MRGKESLYRLSGFKLYDREKTLDASGSLSEDEMSEEIDDSTESQDLKPENVSEELEKNRPPE